MVTRSTREAPSRSDSSCDRAQSRSNLRVSQRTYLTHSIPGRAIGLLTPMLDPDPVIDRVVARLSLRFDYLTRMQPEGTEGRAESTSIAE